jgi:hypothetical protein
MARNNKYKQQADEHPRPHIDIPMSALSTALFLGNDKVLGFFTRMWCHAVWKKDPRFIGHFELESIHLGAIKIGRSQEPLRRFMEIQTASPNRLALLGAVEQDIEEQLHSLLAEHRIKGGEWFRFNDAVRASLQAWKVVASCE